MMVLEVYKSQVRLLIVGFNSFCERVAVIVLQDYDVVEECIQVKGRFEKSVDGRSVWVGEKKKKERR